MSKNRHDQHLKPLVVTTLNMHKGMSPLNRAVKLSHIASELKNLSPDLLMLQEVQGKNGQRAQRHIDWMHEPQHQYLARSLSHRSVYGLNASYDHGHHGNAVLSRFPLQSWRNMDISVNRFESRGILTCKIQPPGWPKPVVALCGHFNLLGHDRRKQYKALASYIAKELPSDVPLILAGDFNDWRREANDYMAGELGLQDVFQSLYGHPALSFPARLPLLALDRIYVRGLQPIQATVNHEGQWRSLSDHLPLTTAVIPL